jgi:Ca2+-dependent lipid-binding protein
MWVEIDDADSKAANNPSIDISPEAVKDFELRLVVWKTKEIEMMDWEGTSDVFMRAYLQPEDDQLSDTHWRCQNGEASFNYRLLFNVKSQQKSYNLTIQAWDKDIVASNDLIGECQIDIEPLFEDVYLTDRQMTLNSKYFEEHFKSALLEKNCEYANDIKFEGEDRFWIPVRRYIQKDDVYVNAGEI